RARLSGAGWSRPGEGRGVAPERAAESRGGGCTRRGARNVTRLVQVALAEDITEAEEIQAILQAAGIDSALEVAVEHHPTSTEDPPQKVLVAESSLEAAQHAIEAMTDPDELVSDA